jgi:MFS family permease
VVAAVVIASLVVAEERPEREEAHLLQQVAEGVRHLVGDRVLAHLVVGFGITLLVIGFGEASIYALMDGFDKPPTYVGFLVTIQGIGAVIGGLLSSRLIRRLGEVGGCVLGLALLAVALFGTATSPVLWIALAWTIPFGAALPLLMVGYMTLLQRRTPRRLMGRVSTAAEVVLATPQAISLAIGSLLVVLLDWRVIFAMMGVVTALSAVYLAVMLRDQLGPAAVSAGAVEDEGDGSVVDALDLHLGPELSPLDPGTPIG